MSCLKWVGYGAIAIVSFGALGSLLSDSEPKYSAKQSANVPQPTSVATPEPSPGSKPDPASTSTLEPALKVVRTTLYVDSDDGEVNLRSCASTNCEILAVLPNGDAVVHSGSRETNSSGQLWFQVNQGSRSGWIYHELLSEKKTAPRIPKSVSEARPVPQSPRFTKRGFNCASEGNALKLPALHEPHIVCVAYLPSKNMTVAVLEHTAGTLTLGTTGQRDLIAILNRDGRKANCVFDWGSQTVESCSAEFLELLRPNPDHLSVMLQDSNLQEILGANF